MKPPGISEEEKELEELRVATFMDLGAARKAITLLLALLDQARAERDELNRALDEVDDDMMRDRDRWQARAEKAEHKRDAARAQVKELREALEQLVAGVQAWEYPDAAANQLPQALAVLSATAPKPEET